MTELAGPMVLAGFLSMAYAAARLLTHTDDSYGRSCVTLTSAFWLYLLFHGLAALLPFPLYHWPNDWPFLIKISPWLTALAMPLVVNGMLKLQGFDVPEATGPLRRFRNQVQKDFEQRLIDAEFDAMRRFLEPYAEGRNLFEVREIARQNIPMQLPAEKAAAFRTALANARSVEDAMELYIRTIGKKSFRRVFRKPPPTEPPTQPWLPLFDDQPDPDEHLQIQ